MLDSQLSSFDKSWHDFNQQEIKKVLLDFNLETVEQLYEDIGTGNRAVYIVARRLLELLTDTDIEDDHSAMTIKGTEGLLIKYGKCCRPIPGDSIVGVMSKGKGMVVHIDSCRNIADTRYDTERCVPLHWDKSMEGEFAVDIRIDLRNSRGVLASVANAVSLADANIDSIQMMDIDASTSRLDLTVTVSSRVHLARVFRRLHGLSSVAKIERK
jgi:(p)ppGpp synthase/HD superfamily hydrolase